MNHPVISEQKALTVSKTALTNARDNQAALAEFGINEAMLNTFAADIQAAEALPTEKEQRIDLKGLTANKNDILAACFNWGRKLRIRMQLAFEDNPAVLNSFPSKDLTEARNSEAQMMPLMKALIKLAEDNHEKLTQHGQSDEIRDEGQQLLTALRTADGSQEMKKDDKKSGTQERYLHFKKLYDTVNRINKVGRIVFENDPVKLVLFESKWHKKSYTAPDAAPSA